MLRRIFFIAVSITLAVSLAVNACAEVSDLAWGMSMEEAGKIMGDPDLVDDETFQDRITTEYLNNQIFGIDAVLVLLFWNDALACYSYSQADDQERTKFKAIGEGLENIYGKSTDDFGPVTNSYDIQYSQSFTAKDYKGMEKFMQFKSWAGTEQGDIVLWSFDTGEEYSVLLQFLRPTDQAANK